MTERTAVRGAGARKIDWEALKSRLSSEDIGDYSDAELEKIFEQRADALARAGAQREHRAAATHLGCRLGTVSLLLPLENVLRIMKPERVARVPGAPIVLNYIMHVDGRIVAVADLRSLLGIERGDETARRMVVLLGDGAHRLALLVHGARELVFVDERSVNPASGSPGTSPDFVIGLSADLALVLDARRLIQGLTAGVGSQS